MSAEVASEGRVEVALPLPIHRTFTYGVEGPPPPRGTRVLVPFRRTSRIGWVVGPGTGEPVRGLKSVLDVLDESPSVPTELFDLCQWMAGYYLAPLGIALRSAAKGIRKDMHSVITAERM